MVEDDDFGMPNDEDDGLGNFNDPFGEGSDEPLAAFGSGEAEPERDRSQRDYDAPFFNDEPGGPLEDNPYGDDDYGDDPHEDSGEPPGSKLSERLSSGKHKKVFLLVGGALVLILILWAASSCGGDGGGDDIAPAETSQTNVVDGPQYQPIPDPDGPIRDEIRRQLEEDFVKPRERSQQRESQSSESESTQRRSSRQGGTESTSQRDSERGDGVASPQ